MKPQVTEIAKRQERALLDLSVAERRVRAAAGSPPSIRQMAISNLRRAEVRARELGVLPTEEEIVEGHVVEARRLFKEAWESHAAMLRLPPAAVTEELRQNVVDVVRGSWAIVEEWGLDPAELMTELDRSGR